MKSYKGFTLIEIIVILAVISILAAMAIPTALRIFQATATSSTNDEMTNLKKAMIGDLTKIQNGVRSDFGFLGDIGCLPTVLDRLLTAGSLPTPYSFDSTKQAGAGWNGPYITGPPGEVLTKDQWGNDYTYTPAAGACPLTATLTSNGPDGQSGTSDDITLSIAAPDTTAGSLPSTGVRGTVKDTTGVPLEGVPVEFYSPSSGALTTTTYNAGGLAPGTDASGNYVFTSVPFGPRAVKVKPNFVYTPGSVTGGGGTTITYRILNYAESNVVINRMRVSWTTPPAQFDRIHIDLGGGLNTCFSGSTTPNVTVTLTCTAAQRTVNAGAARSPMRVFIDASDVKLPDTTITGAGTPATLDFRFTANMAVGTPITVYFNPSPVAGEFSSVIKFTP